MSRARLTTLGDSFVAGHGDEGSDGRRRGWVRRFAELLGLPDDGLTNLGRFGATAREVVAEQLAPALVNKAPLIGVIVGINDLLGDYRVDRFRADVATIFATTRGANTVVFTSTYPEIPRIGLLPHAFGEVVRARFAEANDLVRALAEDNGVLCLDVARAAQWRGPDMWSADGLHPSPLGHHRFAERMAELVHGTIGTGGTW
jgi:lysophospholipase L1-like esterase